jgi:YVTN family beta-propeller protein
LVLVPVAASLLLVALSASEADAAPTIRTAVPAASSVGQPITAYVANSGSGTVTPIRTATNKAGKAIQAGSGPFAVAITPNGQTAYVADENSSAVTPISTATNTAGTPIPVGNDPQYIAITPNGGTAYVANDCS